MLTIINAHLDMCSILSLTHTHTHTWGGQIVQRARTWEETDWRNGPSAYFGFQIRFQPLGPAAPDRFDYGKNHRPNLISTLFTAGCQPCVSAWATTSILFHGHQEEADGLFASCLCVFVMPDKSEVKIRDIQDVKAYFIEAEMKHLKLYFYMFASLLQQIYA